MTTSQIQTTPKIQKLTQEVINRIAAGEVIQRPSSAIKELLENSLDAKSTSITIQIKEGGLKQIRIIDNGHGIKVEDLPLLCERFTTSKLRSFEDLQQISTFGFRGEALASISHVAHISIITKTPDSSCAYKACYADGALSPCGRDGNKDPQPCAGTNGTQINVEDLFYNVLTRKRAFGNANKEFRRIVDVVSKYSILNNHVSFTCKRHDQKSPTLHTSQTTNRTNTIQNIYGANLASQLITFSFENTDYPHSVEAIISNTIYSMKKFLFILFINNRLVDNVSLKKAVESAYSAYLQRGVHPFVFLSIKIPPNNLDVNIHPTKKEVRFLHEEKIIESIQEQIMKKLQESSSSKTFITTSQLSSTKLSSQILIISDKSQTKKTPVKSIIEKNSSLPFEKVKKNLNENENENQIKNTNNENNENNENTKKGAYQYQRVRVDDTDQTLDKFILSERIHNKENNNKENKNNENKNNENNNMEIESIDLLVESQNSESITKNSTNSTISDLSISVDEKDKDKKKKDKKKKDKKKNKKKKEENSQISSNKTFLKKRRKWRDVQLTSIKTLRQEIEDNKHEIISDIFNHHVFVGLIDTRHALIQYQTKLYLVDVFLTTRELFYQNILKKFSNFSIIKFEKALSLKELIFIALNSNFSGWSSEDGDKNEFADSVVDIFLSRRLMLLDYFSIEVSQEGNLCSLPLVINDYIPNFSFLPVLILRLGTEVDWSEEFNCLKMISHELAEFYAFKNIPNFENQNQIQNQNQSDKILSQKEIIQSLVFPTFKKGFVAPQWFMTESVIVEIASLEKLYKIFERC